MLAFILLVVLGGGLGLLAVSLAESPKPATDRGNERRAPDPASDEPVDELVDEALVEPEPSFEAELVEAYAGPKVEPGPPLAATATRRRPDLRDVPPAYTAVEGQFDAVAVPPIWRRLLSICALVAIAVVLGVGVAAAAAAVMGTLAELLNAAVG